jgi:hypothetical protein
MIHCNGGGPTPTRTSTPTTGPTLTPTRTPTPGGATSYEAEAGTRSGAAVVATCTTCSGGNKVGFIGNGAANYVILTVNAATAGSKTMTIYFLVSGTRPMFVSVNGGAGTQLSLTGTSWTAVITTTMTVNLNAGNNTIKFYNDSAYAPDLDRITIQ